MNVTISLDQTPYYEKPDEDTIKEISNRIARRSNRTVLSINEMADIVGNKGHTFCPAVYRMGRRKEVQFERQQIFALDFDGTTSIEEVQKRSTEYKLPIAFMYHTLSSSNELIKFRAVYICDVEVTDIESTKVLTNMLLKIFPEADDQCKDGARMFFGGKGLIGEVHEEVFYVMDLKESFHRVIFENSAKNASRDLEIFAKNNKLRNPYKSNLYISCVHQSGKDEDISADDVYNSYTSIAVFPSYDPKYKIYFGFTSHSYQKDVRKNNNREVIRGDLNGIENKCRLFRDFINEDHIHHNLRQLLLLNLQELEGGQKLFFKIIKENPNYEENKWRFYAQYNKKEGYLPQRCEGNCPYCMECNHDTNMALTVSARESIKQLKTEMSYIEVDEVHKYVQECIETAIRSKENGMFLVPAQTAVGKTQAYIESTESMRDEQYIIAASTVQLVHEIAGRIRKKGTRVFEVPSLEQIEIPPSLREEIDFCYSVGLARKAVENVRSYISKNKKSTDPDTIKYVAACQYYLRAIHGFDGCRVVVMTHARLLTLSEEVISRYTVIIDEDILATCFRNILTVSRATIEKLTEHKECPGCMRQRFKEIGDIPDKECVNLLPVNEFAYLSKKKLKKLGVSENVNELMAATACCRDGEIIHYYRPSFLPRGKYIVLSATMDSVLYKQYFKYMKIRVFEYKKAKYKGKLIQYTAHTMSRRCVEQHKEQLETFLQGYRNDYELITFLRYENELLGSGLHFGNVEGIDRLKGKNILVLGTPHQNPYVYELLGCHLGIPIKGDRLSTRKIQYNGFEFSIMTYKNEELRRIQLYHICKDLEQSIGRARLLREECTVVLLSNFPCEQATLIQEDYLKPKNAEEL